MCPTNRALPLKKPKSTGTCRYIVSRQGFSRGCEAVWSGWLAWRHEGFNPEWSLLFRLAIQSQFDIIDQGVCLNDSWTTLSKGFWTKLLETFERTICWRQALVWDSYPSPTPQYGWQSTRLLPLWQLPWQDGIFHQLQIRYCVGLEQRLVLEWSPDFFDISLICACKAPTTMEWQCKAEKSTALIRRMETGESSFWICVVILNNTKWMLWKWDYFL